MKKQILLLLASMFMLAGCSHGESYYPSNGGNYVPKPEDSEGGGEQEEEEDIPMCTYNFFFSFSATTKYNPYSNKDEDAPILSFSHAMLKPLGSIPEPVNSVDKVKQLGSNLGFEVDPTFPTFIGFSFNGVCLDEEGLWNYETDYKQQAVVNLYGIWVSM